MQGLAADAGVARLRVKTTSCCRLGPHKATSESRNPQEPLSLFLQEGLADLQVSPRLLASLPGKPKPKTLSGKYLGQQE